MESWNRSVFVTFFPWLIRVTPISPLAFTMDMENQIPNHWNRSRYLITLFIHLATILWLFIPNTSAKNRSSLKKRLRHRYLHVNLARFLRTPFLTEPPPVVASQNKKEWNSEKHTKNKTPTQPVQEKQLPRRFLKKYLFSKCKKRSRKVPQNNQWVNFQIRSFFCLLFSRIRTEHADWQNKSYEFIPYA